MKTELSKNDLYEAVKILVETEAPHIHLNQHKLFSLFSIAFQYFLFRSTKEPGAYILRIEDSILAEKLSKKAKDSSTRRFMQTILIPRKLKFNRSVFYLDSFHMGSWNFTNDIPPEKIKGALVVKNTSSRPMDELGFSEGEDGEEAPATPELPPNYFYSCLQEFVPKTIIISFQDSYENVQPVSFPFIKKDKEKTVGGVTLAEDLDWDNLQD